MIIVSQRKTKIINFTNITRIRISRYFDEYYIKCDFSNSSYEDLGIYITEERAKEVLEEIIELFKDEEMFDIRKSALNNLDELAEPKYILKPVSRVKVFEMPLE